MTEHLNNPLRKIVLKLLDKPLWLQQFFITRLFRHMV